MRCCENGFSSNRWVWFPGEEDLECLTPLGEIVDGAKFELVISGHHLGSARYITAASLNTGVPDACAERDVTQRCACSNTGTCGFAGSRHDSAYNTHAKYFTHPQHGFCINTGDIMAKSMHYPHDANGAKVDSPLHERSASTSVPASTHVQHQAVFLGRKDGMVKINGRRIECGEIEQGILHVLGAVLRRVAVVAYKQRLWAFCEVRCDNGSGETRVTCVEVALMGSKKNV